MYCFFYEESIEKSYTARHIYPAIYNNIDIIFLIVLPSNRKQNFIAVEFKISKLIIKIKNKIPFILNLNN